MRIPPNVIEIHFNVGSHPEKGTLPTVVSETVRSYLASHGDSYVWSMGDVCLVGCGVCPGDVCPGECLPGWVAAQGAGICLKGCLPRGCLPRAVCAQWDVCLSGICLWGGVCLGDVCLGGFWQTPPCERNDCQTGVKHYLGGTTLRTVMTLRRLTLNVPAMKSSWRMH